MVFRYKRISKPKITFSKTLIDFNKMNLHSSIEINKMSMSIEK